MSREDLKSFINAAERSLEIRLALKKIKHINDILEIATKYGFKVTLEDLKDDSIIEDVATWFKRSNVYPIKKLN